MCQNERKCTRTTRLPKSIAIHVHRPMGVQYKSLLEAAVVVALPVTRRASHRGQRSRASRVARLRARQDTPPFFFLLHHNAVLTYVVRPCRTAAALARSPPPQDVFFRSASRIRPPPPVLLLRNARYRKDDASPVGVVFPFVIMPGNPSPCLLDVPVQQQHQANAGPADVRSRRHAVPLRSRRGRSQRGHGGLHRQPRISVGDQCRRAGGHQVHPE
mmetsp:Transcript_27718/g.79999  ORF Transcript_27718/g.79999 Transcript_27718/m.79999 type:complete len:216 (-) Transcript_27718:747-1394(-)